jgi:glutathione S-transferase
MPAPVRAVVPSLIRKRVLRGLHARDVSRAGPQRCWERFEKLIAHLDDRAPKNGFWLGNDLSVADVALFGQLQSLRLDLTPWQKSLIERADKLRAWLDRVDAAS